MLPFAFKKTQGIGWTRSIPLVDHVKQITAVVASDFHLLDAVSLRAGGYNAFLKGDVGIRHDGWLQGGVECKARTTINDSSSDDREV